MPAVGPARTCLQTNWNLCRPYRVQVPSASHIGAANTTALGGEWLAAADDHYRLQIRSTFLVAGIAPASTPGSGVDRLHGPIGKVVHKLLADCDRFFLRGNRHAVDAGLSRCNTLVVANGFGTDSHL